jgi:hypothetical protein
MSRHNKLFFCCVTPSSERPLTNTAAVSRAPEILDIKSGKMQLVDFIRKLSISNFYPDYVGLSDTRDFRLVGFTDQLGAFADDFRTVTGIDLGPLGHERENQNKPIIDEEAELEAALRTEVCWHLEQREIWCRG